MLINILVTILILLVIGAIIKMIIYPTVVVTTNDPWVDDEETTTTTTTVTTTTIVDPGPAATPVVEAVEPQPQWDIVGDLEVQYYGKDNQEFVTDPVDKDRVWVNTADDLYQDGADKIWRLVRNGPKPKRVRKPKEAPTQSA
jgi:hypothetical protein